MDRRQRKTREAIFAAFTELLSEKNVSQITVAEIIERADVGRATFYAHFETKDYLLRELCEELFCHIFDSADDTNTTHRHIFECDAHGSAFQHLFFHFKKNDNRIAKLFSCENNEVFITYFKAGLRRLIESQLPLFDASRPKELPYDFWVSQLTSTLVETLRWWTDGGMKESPEQLTAYFLAYTRV